MATLDEKLVGEAWMVAVAGRIDDKLALTPLSSVQRLVLHLGDVTSISAQGVRGLEELLSEVALPTTLIHVPPAVAMQVNLIPSLARVADVQTALLPFICGTCESERRQLLPWRHGADRRYAPVCACGEVMLLDGLAEHYLPPADVSLAL